MFTITTNLLNIFPHLLNSLSVAVFLSVYIITAMMYSAVTHSQNWTYFLFH